MEALLLTLDIAAMVWLCWLIRKSAVSKVGVSFGWFGYRSSPATESAKGVNKGTKGPDRA